MHTATMPVGHTVIPFGQTNTTSFDRQHMKDVIQLSRDAYFKRNLFPIAARIVDPATQTVLAESTNTEIDPNAPLGFTPIGHAEVSAIVAASKKRHTMGKDGRDLSGTVMYTSHYPCPMCWGAMRMAGISRFVYGNSLDQSAQFAHLGFEDKAFYQDLIDPPTPAAMPGQQLYGNKAHQVMLDWQADLKTKGIVRYKKRGETKEPNLSRLA
jgi:guanine deaminase